MKKILFLFLCFNLFSIEYIPYQGRLKEIETEHFKIIFSENHTEKGIIISEYAEDIHKKLTEFLDWKPKEKTLIILTDHTDSPNGLAYTYNRNTIVLYLTHSDTEITLKNYENPLYSLLLHEYTHILHMDNVRGAALFWRIFYGRSLFPNSLIMSFFIEGLAVFCESNFSSGGRLASSYNISMIREAILNKNLPSFDRLIYPVVDWPHGNGVYHYGARFVLYLYNTYGKDKLIEFINSIGSDFIPLMFVLRFKRIYGKSLKELWNDWLEYEKSQIVKNFTTNPEKSPLLDLQGELLSFTKSNERIYVSISSYKYNNGIYVYDEKTNKLKLVKDLYSKNIKVVDNILFYTKFNSYKDNFFYSDLYFYDLNKKINKKLTLNKRVTSFDCFNKTLFFATYSANGSSLFSCLFENNSIKDIVKIDIPERIDFIDRINLDREGKKVIFGAREIDSSRAIFIYNIYEKSFIKLPLYGLNPHWYSLNEIVFISNDMREIYKYNIITKDIYRIYESNSCIIDIYVFDKNIYYTEYTDKGESLFLLENQDEKRVEPPEITKEREIERIEVRNYKIKDYNPLSYLEPNLWFYLPVQLSSSFYIGSIEFPFIAPKYSIVNFTPENRFSYNISITYDYINQYPENNIDLTLNLPYCNIYYSFHNWIGRSKFFYNNKWYYEKIYPVCFSNIITFYFPISLSDYGNIELTETIRHSFYQYTNRIDFIQSFTYYYIKKSFSSSRWDKGFLFYLTLYLTPPNILNNKESYILNSNITGRVPLKNSFFYGELKSGFNILQNNIFRVDSPIINIGSGDSSSSLSYIDTKAFSYTLNGVDINGFFYLSLDTGFDITIYKRSHYWHFLTMGFRELYFKIYNEFVYVLNSNNYKSDFLFDIVFQLNLDLFLIYGHLPLNLTLGGSIGYLIGDNKPSWGVFFYLSSGIDISIGEKLRDSLY